MRDRELEGGKLAFLGMPEGSARGRHAHRVQPLIDATTTAIILMEAYTTALRRRVGSHDKVIMRRLREKDVRDAVIETMTAVCRERVERIRGVRAPQGEREQDYLRRALGRAPTDLRPLLDRLQDRLTVAEYFRLFVCGDAGQYGGSHE